MNNQQLLELAAKAIGLQGAYCEWYEMGEQFYWGIRDGRTWGAWNPLEDDGDALRLAVRLQISICQNIIRVEASTISTVLAGVKVHEDTLHQDGDVATRRAIVWAAAAIGAGL